MFKSNFWPLFALCVCWFLASNSFAEKIVVIKTEAQQFGNKIENLLKNLKGLPTTKELILRKRYLALMFKYFAEEIDREINHSFSRN